MELTELLQTCAIEKPAPKVESAPAASPAQSQRQTRAPAAAAGQAKPPAPLAVLTKKGK